MKIVVENATKTLRDAIVLNQISLEMESGQIYGLQGVNGSGKTMLMRMISGLILPDAGHVMIDGKTLGQDISFPEEMGILIENPSFLSGYTAFKNLQLIASLREKIGNQEIKDALTSVGLDPMDSRKYRKFSLGMKQRLGIACAIMEKPELVILDEPFNALDGDGVEKVETIIRELRANQKLVILSSHDKEKLETLSDHIFYMSEGKILEGETA